MARHSTNKLTNTNYQDYLIDFSGTDFSTIAQPQPEPEAELGWFDKGLNTAKAIGEGVLMIPEGIVDSVKAIYEGGDIDVTDKEAMQAYAKSQAEKEAYLKKYEGKTFDGSPEAMLSLPYSLTTMAGTLGGGLAGTALTGGNVIAGAASGIAASGAAAYRATKNDIMRQLLGVTYDALGREPTQEEWDRVAKTFDGEATRAGIWEAAPEAVGNLFFTKILGPLGSQFKGGVKGAIKSIAGLYGEEMATETATQWGQGGIEAELGLREKAPTLPEAFAEQAPTTFWQTSLMGAGKKGIDFAYNRYRGEGKQGDNTQPLLEDTPSQEEVSAAPFEGAASLGGAVWNAPEPDIDTQWNVAAQDRGLSHLTDGNIGGKTQPEQGMPVATPDSHNYLIEAARYLGSTAKNRGITNSASDSELLQITRNSPDEMKNILRAWEEGYFISGDTSRAWMIDNIASSPELQAGLTPVINEESSLFAGVRAVIGGIPFNNNIPTSTALEVPQELLGKPYAVQQPNAKPLPTNTSAQQVQSDGIAQTETLLAENDMPLGDMNVVHHTPKAFALIGNTLPYKEQILQLGGRWNNKLGGWVFPNKRLNDVKAAFSRVLPQPEAVQDTSSAIPNMVESIPTELPVTHIQGESNAQSGTDTGRSGNQYDAGGRGFLEDGRAVNGSLDEGILDGGRRTGNSEQPATTGGSVGRRVAIKIPNRPDTEAEYTLLEADAVQASHLPSIGFQKNPRYQLENERRYHAESGSQAKVLENAARLDPDFLLESVDANHGAPIIDRQGNVLGGNGRAMSITKAYENGNGRDRAYIEALKNNAEKLGIDSADVDAMRTPMLVRRLTQDLPQEERQQLVTAMNDDFKDSKDKRAAGKSRGDRVSNKTLSALAKGFGDADSLRQYFDTPESAETVNLLLEDGVIQPSERNALIGVDGLLNPDGKRVVEEALRGRVARSYDALAKLPADVVAKIDAVIPHILVAENIGGKWNITDHVRDAVDLLSGYKASGIKDASVYLKQIDMTSGKAPIQHYSKQAIAIFKAALGMKKAEFIKAFAGYVGNAKISPENGGGMMGVAKTQEQAFNEYFHPNEGIDQQEKPQGRSPQEKIKEESAPQGKPPQEMKFSPDEEFQRGMKAMERVIADHVDIHDAMYRKDVGKISFYWGNEGRGSKLKGGSGVSHIIARRNMQGQNGESIAKNLVSVLAYGTKTKEQIAEAGSRVFIQMNGHTAVLSLYKMGKRETWLLTGWQDSSPDAQSKVYDSENATSSVPTRFQNSEGAGDVKNNISSPTEGVKENGDVEQHTSGNLERDSKNVQPKDGMGTEGVLDDGRTNGEARGSGSGQTGTELSAPSGKKLSGSAPSAAGEGSNTAMAENTSRAQERTARSEQRGGSGGDVGNGLAADRGAAEAIGKPAEASGSKGVEGKDREAHLQAIKEELPKLYQGQQEDVLFAEKRFKVGAGVIFTNGTGTGKTGLGLGIISRLVHAGRNNILIAVPADKIGTDWKNLGELLGVDVYKLTDTKDLGKGVTITTHANMAQNTALVKRDWDLVVIDESHKLSSSEDGKETELLKMLRAISKHPRGAAYRAQLLPEGAEIYSIITSLHAKKDKSEKEKDELRAAFDAFNTFKKTVEKDVWQAQGNNRADLTKESEGRSGVLFLSATPFAYEKNVDYAEGYLFDYPKNKRSGSYNAGGDYDKFMMEHFGYRMRYNKLTRPESDAASGTLQREFNSWLKKLGVLSSRQLDTPYDYDRKFILTENAVGQKIDEGLNFLHENFEKYRNLDEVIGKRFDHLRRRYLLEAIKSKEAIPIIQKNLDMGRKVVVFHQFNKGGGFNPFDVTEIIKKSSDKDLIQEAEAFRKERPDLINLPLNGLSSPVSTLTTAFPDAVVFSGLVSKKDREKAVNDFQRDDSGTNLIIVQADAGEAGLSLHDTTGKHQRVLINLGLPTKPVTAIQQEGRIFRAGQQSNAMFRYLNTGTSWERTAFASTIAQRASAAENLAMGEEARGLRDSFIEGFIDSTAADIGEHEGTGGKAHDRALQQVTSEFERAKGIYLTQEKRNSRTKSREGIDYFATPEPLGQKMVEWAGIKSGMKVLEPSAGHGAIARWFPEDASRTVVEPSSELASRLMLAVGDAKVINSRFEDLHISNKYDAIVMNPPFGAGGKMAMAHIEKAFSHLSAGGRMVALVPDGSAMQKRLNAFFDYDEKTSIAPILRQEISLPEVTFERAGTKVRTKVLIIDAVDKNTRADMSFQPANTRELSAKNIDELFDKIENIRSPEKIKVEDGNSTGDTIGSEIATADSIFETAETTHAIKKIPLFVVTKNKLINKNQYYELECLAKKHNGYYSAYDKRGAIPGWQFGSPKERLDFLKEAKEYMHEQEAQAEQHIRQAESYASLNDKAKKDIPARNRNSFIQAIRKHIDVLNKKAHSAAPVTVVDSFDDLPLFLRRLYAGNEQSLEAAYAPSEGRIYMVANNIKNISRATEVWGHEQVVHHGLRSMMTEGERKILLNQLWLLCGGMGNTRIANIAQRYGIDPRRDNDSRNIVMEEYLANLSEAQADSILTGKDKDVWRQLVKAVQRFLNSIAQVAIGRPLFTTAYIDDLLTSLGAHVMGGLPVVHITAGQEAAYASQRADDGNNKPVTVVTIDESIVPEFSKARDLARWIKNYFTDKPIELIKSTGKTVRFGKGNLEASLKRSREQNHSKSYAGLDALVRNAEYDKTEGRDGRHPNLSGQEVYYSAMRLGGKLYAVRMKFDIPSTQEVNTRRERRGEEDIEDLRYKDHTLKEIEIAPILYREVSPLQEAHAVTEAINEITLGVLRGAVKPSSLENGALSGAMEREIAIDNPQAFASLGNAGARRTLNLFNRIREEDPSWFPKKTDITMMQRVFSLPHALAQKFPRFGKIYQRELERLEERSTARIASMQEIPSLFGQKSEMLAKQDMDDLKRLLRENDGKQVETLKDVEKFIVVGELDNGREILEKNPKWDEGFKEWAKNLAGSEAARKAFIEVRQSLDRDFIRIHNTVADMSEVSDDAIAEYRNTFGHIDNYFPHQRYGKYYIQVRDGKEGAVVYREHFDAPTRSLAKRKAEELRAKLEKQYPSIKNGGKYFYRADENEKLSEDVYGAPMDTEAMEQVIKAATSRIADKEQAKLVRDVLHKGVADTLKMRGFGVHELSRLNTPGYEQDDILRVLSDYKAGLYGWLTKMQAARDFSTALGGIDAKAHPAEWSYASQYVEDMLRNSDTIDRVTGNIKAACFAWFLGANIKTAVVNLTQNVIVGVPLLQMDTVRSAGYLQAARDALVDQATGKKGKGLKDDEAQLIKELYDSSVITDALMEELRGRVDGLNGSAIWNKALKWMGMPMSVAERFNRASLALAAYRAARDGNLKEQVRAKYGIKDKATYEQAKAYAGNIVNDAHFVYGKANMPEFFRSTAIGRAVSPIYTFRSFSHNLLLLWSRMLQERGSDGAKMVAKGLGGTVALGGLTTFPMYATLTALAQAVGGDDDDWTEQIRKALPDSEWLRDMVCYGLPSLGGVNIGGSLKMETPFTQGITRGGTVKEVALESLGQILGIPWAFVEMADKAGKAAHYGDSWRAIEALSPVAIKNAMSAWRLLTEGQKTNAGIAINDIGQKGARKLTAAEAASKALGFQPVSSTKAYDKYAANRHADKVRSERKNDFAVLWLKGIDSGDVKYKAQARRELKAYNQAMRVEGKPWMMITLDEVTKIAAQRRREHKGSKREKQREAVQGGVW